jgi:hypothetical protein
MKNLKILSRSERETSLSYNFLNIFLKKYYLGANHSAYYGLWTL